jgi:FkbM family methyltransferase
MVKFKINEITHNINDQLSLETIYNHINTWEPHSFKIIEKCSDKLTVFIDIGAHIGSLSIHAAGLYKSVYSVECDSEALKSLKQNILDNSITNCTVINRALYNIDDQELDFGGNGKKGNSMSTLLINESSWNQGANWLIEHKVETPESIHSDREIVKTITFDKLISNYQIDPVEIGLIKIDIEGGEKYIFDDNFKKFLITYRPDLLISLHYVFLNDIDCHKILLFLNTIYNCYNMKNELLNITHEIRNRDNHTEIFCTKR